mmetsp:Transcript_29507/g.94579  ORF Transcript_29507/g.94579 Transcript_29507/m.94579 type:complete len:137 (-) Transcript_29507:1263-1673(-)
MGDPGGRQGKTEYFTRPSAGARDAIPAGLRKAGKFFGFSGGGLVSWAVAAGAAYFIWVRPRRTAPPPDLGFGELTYGMACLGSSHARRAWYGMQVKPEQDRKAEELNKRTAYIEELKKSGQWDVVKGTPISVSTKR